MHTILLTPADSVQRTVDALPRDGEEAVLRLAPGVYREKIVLDRPRTALEGAGAGRTVIRWGDGARDVLPSGEKRRTFRTATLRTDGVGITLRALTVENTAGPGETAGQAIALYADGDGFRCEDCVLRGRQDTLFTAPPPPKEVEPGGFTGPKQFAPRVPQRHDYLRCRIEGDVDFIFGGAAARFADCEIVTVFTPGREGRAAWGWCTAASTPEGQTMGYLFEDCRFLAEAGVPDGSVYLGRPWREHAKTALRRCFLGAHIHPAHWDDWGKEAFHSLGRFEESGSTGPGAPAPLLPAWAHADP